MSVGNRNDLSRTEAQKNLGACGYGTVRWLPRCPTLQIRWLATYVCSAANTAIVRNDYDQDTAAQIYTGLKSDLQQPVLAAVDALAVGSDGFSTSNR